MVKMTKNSAVGGFLEPIKNSAIWKSVLREAVLDEAYDKEFDIKILIERSLASHVKSFCSSLYINDDDENRMARVCSKTQNALHAF